MKCHAARKSPPPSTSATLAKLLASTQPSGHAPQRPQIARHVARLHAGQLDEELARLDIGKPLDTGEQGGRVHRLAAREIVEEPPAFKHAPRFVAVGLVRKAARLARLPIPRAQLREAFNAEPFFSQVERRHS